MFFNALPASFPTLTDAGCCPTAAAARIEVTVQVRPELVARAGPAAASPTSVSVATGDTEDVGEQPDCLVDR
jgi:hypothetical protein